MRRSRLLRVFGPKPARRSTGDLSAAPADRPPDDDQSPERRAHSASRQQLAREHGWTYIERDTRAIQGWPRTALPPGPLGRVRDEITGHYRGRSFRYFDYVHRESEHAPWRRLAVCAVNIPVQVPYLYVRDPGGGHEFYAESPEADFALELLSDDVREDIRENGFTDLVIDRDLLICTAAGGGPHDVEPRLDALTRLISHVPADVWAHWGR
ncbi:hypothetical protein HNR23_000130 [Nocardiopsis mwathae]|uniref:Uncharacterized protein n=1 Tax=Nocardiopsis mwathae TaxID=1472723 RepID=A0A7W9YDQ0_9ACTN|nr:hypothetical protein [Nocardiopsis mwathae]MBB6170070.1 hypothetical protein [Nocardiopsis mwathae]